ncbi:hypothetical protein [Thiohalophilus sp.]
MQRLMLHLLAEGFRMFRALNPGALREQNYLSQKNQPGGVDDIAAIYF